MKHYLYWLIGLFIYIAAVLPANAAALQVTPTQLHLSAAQPIGSVTLANQGDQPILLQLHASQWQQENGKDRLQDSSALIINPPIVTIPAHDEQIIRVGFNHANANTDIEQCYRIFIKEVLPAKLRAKGLNTILQISLPVFIAPTTEDNSAIWQAVKLNDDHVRLTLTNSGNTHIQISHIALYPIKQQQPAYAQTVFAYILPQQQKSWDIKLPQVSTYKLLKLSVDTDKGKIFENVSITP